MIQEKSVQQELFDTVYAASVRLGFETYDYAPPETSYPFVYIGEQFEQEQRTKSGPYAIIQQSIHIYHQYRDRRDLTTIIENLKKELRQLRQSGSFYFAYRTSTVRTMTDTSTSDTLLHAVLEVEFRIN